MLLRNGRYGISAPPAHRRRRINETKVKGYLEVCCMIVLVPGMTTRRLPRFEEAAILRTGRGWCSETVPA